MSSLLPFFLDEPRKNMLLQKGYHSSVVIYSINDVLNRSQQNGPKHPTTTVPKKEIFLILPFLCLQNKRITEQQNTCINKSYVFIDFTWVIFQSVNRSIYKRYKVSCWDFMIEKPKISKRFFNTSSYPYDTADQVTSTGHNL